VGAVHFYKRRGSKNIRLSVSADGVIKVTLPYWVPYKAATDFVLQKQRWLLDRQVRTAKLLEPNQRIGKGHGLRFVIEAVDEPRSRIAGNEIRISHPAHLSHTDQAVQDIAHKAALRALKLQAEQLLPQRLALLSTKCGLDYRGLTIRHLKTRWGSCNSQQDITLNYYLMQLPWSLIDYVLVHELAHTRHLNHSPTFWQEVERHVPDHKARRKELRGYSPSVLGLTPR
jgi:predicted metal-dependent hydrolase